MTSMPLLARWLRRAVLGRRRLLAAVLAAVAMASALRVATAPPPSTTTVLTAARDLPSGHVVESGDLRSTRFLPGSVPSGVVDADDAVGRTTAAPVREGEPLTDRRLVQASLLDGYPGSVAMPLRIGDADAVRLLRVGDRVDLLAAHPEAAEATELASDVPVLALPAMDDSSFDDAAVPGGGALVVVAIPRETARRAAALAVSSYISVVIRR